MAIWSYEANQSSFRQFTRSSCSFFDNIYIDTTFCKTDSKFIRCRESCLSVIFQAVSAWLCSYQNNVVHFCNKSCYGYEFLMKELALSFNTKFHVTLCQYQLYKFVPSIQIWLTLDGESTKFHFCKPSSASANLKLPWKPGIPGPEVLAIIPTAMFFTKNEMMPGRLVEAVSERTIRCCYSSHSSADEINDSFRVCSSKVLHPSFVQKKIFHLIF